MTVHFISIGVSLLQVLRDARTAPQLGERRDLRNAIHVAGAQRLLNEAGVLAPAPPGGAGLPDQQDREKACAWFAAALAQPADPVARALIDKISEKIRPAQWPSRISAELSTFDSIPDASLPLTPGDTAVLISSDTPDGLVAALWNAVALTHGDLDRLRFLDGMSAPAGDLTGQAVIARIPGMDAGTDEGFCEAMRGLGTLGRRLLSMVGHQPLNFYLSGGYKAAIPYLIGLAEGLRGVPDAGPVKAYVLHETTDIDTPIRLPLRMLTPEWVRGELGVFDADGISTDKPPGPGLLRGYAYEQRGDQWELTPFGAGLTALFDLPHEGLIR